MPGLGLIRFFLVRVYWLWCLGQEEIRWFRFDFSALVLGLGGTSLVCRSIFSALVPGLEGDSPVSGSSVVALVPLLRGGLLVCGSSSSALMPGLGGDSLASGTSFLLWRLGSEVTRWLWFEFAG